jgi:hypothetical protein
MKRVFAVLLAACAVAMLAACGGGNNATNAPTDNRAHDGHGHGDEHGEAHKIGEKQIGDYMVEVARVESKETKEGIYEIKVTKDGKSVKDVPVDAWIGDKDGKHITEPAGGEWMEEEGLYDCHVRMPEKLDGARLWVQLRTAAPFPKGDFDVDHD